MSSFFTIIHIKLLSYQFHVYKTLIHILNDWYLNFFLFLFLLLCVVFTTTSYLFSFAGIFFLLLKRLVDLSIVSLPYNIIYFTPTLIIGLASIHPPIYYIGLSFFFLLNTPVIMETVVNFNKRTIALLIFALLLGGFWSLCLMYWSYYWVFDLIEWIVVLFLICTLIPYHKLIYKISGILPQLLFNFLVIIVIFIRLGVFKTRHSFFQGLELEFLFKISFLLVFFFIWGFMRKDKNLYNTLTFLVICMGIVIYFHLFLLLTTILIYSIAYFFLCFVHNAYAQKVQTYLMHFLIGIIIILLNIFYVNFTTYYFYFRYNNFVYGVIKLYDHTFNFSLSNLRIQNVYKIKQLRKLQEHLSDLNYGNLYKFFSLLKFFSNISMSYLYTFSTVIPVFFWNQELLVLYLLCLFFAFTLVVFV